MEDVYIMRLIENVEKKKCLYDKRDPFYFNRNVKERAWKEVGEICGKNGSDCKHKWKLLRERFVKEVKRMDAPSGSGMAYLKEWRFLQPLLFLKDSLAPRRTRDNVGTQTETDVECNYSDLLMECATPSPPPAKKCRATMDTLCERFTATVENIERSIVTPVVEKTDTADEAFTKSFVILMRDLPADVKDDFQASLMQELYRLRKANRSSSV